MPRRPENSVRPRLVAYRIRLLAAVAVVLAGTIAAVRTPWFAVEPRVGWRIVPADEIRAIDAVRFEPGPPPSLAVPTRFEAPAAERVDVEAPPSVDTGLSDAGYRERTTARPERAMERLVLAAAQQMPEIRGGLGAYYIHIVYPQAAVDAGIQGRLVLDFVVEADGRPTEIEIYKSLHPLCDSAAVQALRQTMFMPGRHDGKNVAVRMRLPVLFRLVGPEQDSGS